ncbi:unnamed protein product [Chondrus crispus]|uniref:Uncharacterized protein n=1 Tax=Chondrus crispus TaxID=2769 RepID=R7QSI2_CHOCR|nr:unnamed protein product [Chondrus crispus]CDF40345.1 unnamed protein product [Chondrus crispus]|eukprot:XP_005710639.1 unnamed protein product [Chondrus crispus]
MAAEAEEANKALHRQLADLQSAASEQANTLRKEAQNAKKAASSIKKKLATLTATLAIKTQALSETEAIATNNSWAIASLEVLVEEKDIELTKALKLSESEKSRASNLHYDYVRLERKIQLLATDMAKSEIALEETTSKLQSAERQAGPVRNVLLSAQAALNFNQDTYARVLNAKEKELAQAAANALALDNTTRLSISDNVHFGADGSEIGSDRTPGGHSLSPCSSSGVGSIDITPPKTPERKSSQRVSSSRGTRKPKTTTTPARALATKFNSRKLLPDRSRKQPGPLSSPTTAQSQRGSHEEPTASSPKHKWDGKRSRTSLRPIAPMEDSFRSMQGLLSRKEHVESSEETALDQQPSGFSKRSLSQDVRSGKQQDSSLDTSPQSQSMNLKGLLRKKSKAPTTTEVALPRGNRAGRKARTLKRFTNAVSSNIKLNK